MRPPVNADSPAPQGYTTAAFVTAGATADHKPSINAEFSEDLQGSDLAQTIAHEGSHIEDDMPFLNSYDQASGTYAAWLNILHFDTEFRAFDVGSMVKPYSMFPAGAKGYRQSSDYINRAYLNANLFVFGTNFPQRTVPQ